MEGSRSKEREDCEGKWGSEESSGKTEKGGNKCDGREGWERKGGRCK